MYRLHEAALAHQHSGDDDDNACEHNDALNKIVDCGRHIAAGNDVNRREKRHQNNADGVINVECHAEQAGQTVIQRCGVRNEENEDDDRCADLERGAVKARAEKGRHGCGVQMLRHNTGASSENHPRQQGTDERIADADPGRGETVFPAELTCIADKNNGGEIGCAVGKGSQPRTDRASAQHKAVDICRMPAAVQADADQHGEVNK